VSERYWELENGTRRVRERVRFRPWQGVGDGSDHDPHHEWFDYGIALSRAVQAAFPPQDDYWLLTPGILALAVESLSANTDLSASVAKSAESADEERCQAVVREFFAAAEAVCNIFRETPPGTLGS